MRAERQLRDVVEVSRVAREAHGAVEVVLAYGRHRDAGGGSYEHCHVLAKIDNPLHPYAVWMLVAPSEPGRKPFLCGGHYCETEERAREVFGQTVGVAARGAAR